jgi:hypothetical protein
MLQHPASSIHPMKDKFQLSDKTTESPLHRKHEQLFRKTTAVYSDITRQTTILFVGKCTFLQCGIYSNHSTLRIKIGDSNPKQCNCASTSPLT